MIEIIGAILAAFTVFFQSRLELSLEVLALRQQVAVLKRKRRRPMLSRLDRLFWIMLRMVWPRWSDVLDIVKPATVVAWHREGFRLYWRWRSSQQGGRPRVSEEIRNLIRKMRLENAGWGAPKIHGELLKLGFEISERTVARCLQALRPRTGKHGQCWKAFLANHREAIVAFDLFAVPTLTFELLYAFLIIEHGRRKILHCNVTPPPTSEWVVQQLKEAFPESVSVRICDLRPRLEIQCRGNPVAHSDRFTTEAHERPGAVAKRNCGTVGWKLQTGAIGPRHPTE